MNTTTTNNTTAPTTSTTTAAKPRLPILAPRKSAPIAMPMLPSSMTIGSTTPSSKPKTSLPVVRRTVPSAAPASQPVLSLAPQPRSITRPSLPAFPEEDEYDDLEAACDEEMDAIMEMQEILDEEHETRASSATSNMGLSGKLKNPRIRDLVKGFRYMSWNSHGTVRSGRITRRNKNTVSVEPFDAPAGHSASVGYGLIYDVEPRAPNQPSANDRVKAALATATYVSWKGDSGQIIVGSVIRRNDKTMSVLPLGETNPEKYWRIPYAHLTAVSLEQVARLSGVGRR